MGDHKTNLEKCQDFAHRLCNPEHICGVVVDEDENNPQVIIDMGCMSIIVEHCHLFDEPSRVIIKNGRRKSTFERIL